jgi:hypothetical protein
MPMKEERPTRGLNRTDTALSRGSPGWGLGLSAFGIVTQADREGLERLRWRSQTGANQEGFEPV